MKSVILALALLAPLSAKAETNLTCQMTLLGQVTFHVISDGDVATQGAVLTIIANGVLHTVIDATVESVDASQEGKLILEVSTLSDDGQVTPESGKATITLGIQGKRDENGSPASGTAKIVLTKNPPRHPGNIIFLPEYELVSCKGTI